MKVLILEDEPAASRRLRKMLHKLDEHIEIVAELESIAEGKQWFSENQDPDLILSDIRLADGLSFTLLAEMSNQIPLVFVTAYDEYAIRAFHLFSIDYLLKPVVESDLERALHKFRTMKAMGGVDYTVLKDVIGQVQQMSAETGVNSPPQRVLVRAGNQLKAVEINKAAYFYTENKIVYFQGFTGKRQAIDEKMEHLDQWLDSSRFFRINRQFIVCIDAIENMVTYSKSRIKLNLRPSFTEDSIVSKERTPLFKKWLTGKQ